MFDVMSDPHARFRRFRLLAIASGIVMIVSPFIGLAGTVLGMTSAFDTMGTRGVQDTGHLSAAIGEVLVSTASGLGIALLGFPFFITFLVLAIIENRKLKQMSPAPLSSSPAPPP